MMIKAALTLSAIGIAYITCHHGRKPSVGRPLRRKLTMRRISRGRKSAAIAVRKNGVPAVGAVNLAPKWRTAFTVASFNLAIVGGSLVFPVLVLLTIPGTIYTSLPVMRLAFTSLRKGKLSSYVIDSILIVGLVIGGFLRLAALGLWIATLGRVLLLYSENRSKSQLADLFGEQPREASIVINGSVEVVTIDDLLVGDIVAVAGGQVISVDGVIVHGAARIDERLLTGESILVEKGVGDPVFATTMVAIGNIHVEARKTGNQTVAKEIGAALVRTSDFTSMLQSRGERVADRLAAPTLMLSSVLTILAGPTSGLAVLTNTFGYKMRVFAPASMLSYLSVASRHGILIKDGRSLDVLNKIDTVIVDKTGTLTTEKPSLVAVRAADGIDTNNVLLHAAAAEAGQTHPLAMAVREAAAERGLRPPIIDQAAYRVGYGVEVRTADCVVHVGSDCFIREECLEVPDGIVDILRDCQQRARTVVLVAVDHVVIGVLEFQAALRPEAPAVIAYLRRKGKRVYILSGDREAPTRALADALELDGWFAGILPDGKSEIIDQFHRQGKTVCFVGDGINDALALKSASVSISMRGATTMAQDAAQIVLMRGGLTELIDVFEIGANYEKNARTNLAISTIPSCISVGGIIFFHWGVAIGTLIAGSVWAAGITNAALPALVWRREQSSVPGFDSQQVSVK